MKGLYRIIAVMKPGILFLLFVLILLSCKRKWSQKDRSEFMSGCLSNAVRDTSIGERLARNYCECILEKVVLKYPNANDINYIKYDTAITGISRSCLEMVKFR